MFTGIITALGAIENINKKEKDITFTISCPYPLEGIDLGCSIACDGACLTVIKKEKSANKTLLDFDVSHETINKTTLGNWQIAKKINMERSLLAATELGGHIVSGHVDAIGKITEKKLQGESWDFKISFPEDLKKYIAPKGSITVNGISLTVNSVNGNEMSLTIIPHTMENTGLGFANIGDEVNLEIDVIARYVANFLENSKSII